MKYLFLILPFFCFSQTVVLTDDDIKAVPIAEGFGQDATGGRGGSNVWKVTNLNTTGTGSLDWALRSNGTGYIIFDVSGVIRHASTDNLVIVGGTGGKTIDFATAPGDGIELQGAELRIQNSNQIIRNARIRQENKPSDGNDDCIRITSFNGSVYDVFIDRVSLYYSVDEHFSIEGHLGGGHDMGRVTVSNSIFAHPDYAALVFERAYEVSLIRNISAHVSDRDFYASTHQSSREVVNSVVYDGTRPLNFTAGENSDWVGMHLIPMGEIRIGGQSSGAAYYMRHNVNTNNSPSQTLSDSEIYEDDTLFETTNYIGSPGFTALKDPNYSNFERGSRFFSTGNYTPAFPSSQVLDTVLSTTSGAGATPWNRDAIDQKVIDDITNRLNTDGRIDNPSYSNNAHYANPSFSQRGAGWDTDDDGLPDTYEALNGNPVSTDRFTLMTLPSGVVIDQTNVTANIRYTYLDGYLYDINGDWDKFVQTPGGDSGLKIKGSGHNLRGSNGQKLKMITN